MADTIDLRAAHDEFDHLKQQNLKRNEEYYLLRQAVKGNFRWPRDWPIYMPKVKHNLCKPITERFTTYLMGKGFSYNVERPNTIEARQYAERTEKILRRLLRLSTAKLQFDHGARSGSQLGRSIFKVYRKGAPGAQHACFAHVQPDYFYGVPAGDNELGAFATVYYSYPMDRSEAIRIFGPADYKTESEMTQGSYYDPLREESGYASNKMRDRRVPVLETWTRDAYALEVGGVVVYNGKNENRWSATGEGFIPFVVIENIRNAGEAQGEADIAQARELNEQLNYLLSRKQYIVGRWLQPTLVWEGAPQNYLEVLTSTIGGGGAIPARLGSRLYFLAYDRPNPAVQELEAGLRQAILESCGMSEIALQGTVQGSINTGPALEAQFTPALSTIAKKQLAWECGLEQLFAMLLQIQEDIGDSKALGEAVVNADRSSQFDHGGELVTLSGKDINGLREVTITWPGVLPKDDAEYARLEMEKASQGLQSFYTTLEKLGEDYPDDELARIRMENNDPALRGEKVAEQMRAEAPLVRAEAEAQLKQAQIQQMAMEPAEEPAPVSEEDLLAQGNLGARLRELNRRARPTLNLDGDEPVIEAA